MPSSRLIQFQNQITKQREYAADVRRVSLYNTAEPHLYIIPAVVRAKKKVGEFRQRQKYLSHALARVVGHDTSSKTRPGYDKEHDLFGLSVCDSSELERYEKVISRMLLEMTELSSSSA